MLDHVEQGAKMAAHAFRQSSMDQSSSPGEAFQATVLIVLLLVRESKLLGWYKWSVEIASGPKIYPLTAAIRA